MIKEPLQARYLWLFAFCFATTASLLFQKFLLPLMPSLHAGSGLLMQDAALFHHDALLLADNIHTQGWSSWSAWSAQTGTTGNVAVLSALYAVFSPDPALIIPVNAFLHASSALLLLLLAREIWPGRVGNAAGLIAATLFVVFPSALSWYSQPLKDSYVIAGTLLVLYSWVRALNRPLSVGNALVLLAWMVAGLFLLAFVKFYYLRMLLFIAVLIAGLVAVHVFWTKHQQRYRILSFFFVVIAVIAVMLGSVKPAAHESGLAYSKWTDVAEAKWRWEKFSWLADALEGPVETAARTRAAMIRYNQTVGAQSLIDADRAPQSVPESIQYIPRALQIALFAPFPDTWLEKRSAPRLLAAVEMTIWYLLAPGLILALYYRRSLALTVTLLFALFFLAVFSFVTPNVGTLYRYRYAFEFLMIMIAASGWVSFILSRPKKKPNRIAVPDLGKNAPVFAAHKQTNAPPPSKRKLINMAVVVSLLTLLVSLGFFARDLLMMRWFGAGNEMDAYFLGTMLPMFFVSVLVIPAGAAFIPAYTEQSQRANPAELAQFVRMALWHLIQLLLIVSVLLYFLGPQLFSLLNWHYDNAKMAAIHEVMNVYLWILTLGGVVVIANAVLNAEGRTIFPAAAQLAVPFVVLLSLLLFGTSHGVFTVIYAMLAGLFVNIALLVYALRGHAFWSFLRLKPTTEIGRLPINQYALQAAVALSTALFVPVSNAIAANLSPGSVAIIGLGTKVVLFVTGVIGIGMTTVLLPYFSGLIAKYKYREAQADLSFFLLLVTLLSVPAALILAVLVEPMTSLIFAHSALTKTDIQGLIRVIQYGVIQLPFFTCGLVTIKYITAFQRSGVILLSSLVGLVLSILLGVIFAKYLGVGGIALALTLSMGVSTAILVFYANHLKHLPFSDSAFIALNWTLFLTLFLCLHYQVYVGVIISAVVYLLLVAGNWQAVIKTGLRLGRV